MFAWLGLSYSDGRVWSNDGLSTSREMPKRIVRSLLQLCFFKHEYQMIDVEENCAVVGFYADTCYDFMASVIDE
jgi:hypothetical protein